MVDCPGRTAGQGCRPRAGPEAGESYGCALMIGNEPVDAPNAPTSTGVLYSRIGTWTPTRASHQEQTSSCHFHAFSCLFRTLSYIILPFPTLFPPFSYIFLRFHTCFYAFLLCPTFSYLFRCSPIFSYVVKLCHTLSYFLIRFPVFPYLFLRVPTCSYVFIYFAIFVI